MEDVDGDIGDWIQNLINSAEFDEDDTKLVYKITRLSP